MGREPELADTPAPVAAGRQEPIPLVVVPCPRCGSALFRGVCRGKDYLHGIGGEYQASECLGCGLWYQNPRPDAAYIGRLYPDCYGPHTGTRRCPRARRASGRGRLLHLAPEPVPGGRILEIGCADGKRLEALGAAGWENPQGIEMAPKAAERARARGFQVRCGSVETEIEGYPDGYFDAVIASMVLEHLVDPFGVVGQIARKLKPGGQFLFSTVVRDGLDARWYGRYWSSFDFPRHMVYFHHRDVVDMLSKDFRDLRRAHQNAPIDYVRASSWRNKPWDRLVVALFRTPLGDAIGISLAWLRLGSRVSYRCRRI